MRRVSGVVYKMKSTGPSTDLCAVPGPVSRLMDAEQIVLTDSR